jgi:hypothetical protein
LFWDAATRIIDEETGDAAAVDPVWPEQVLQAAQLEGANVKAVLTTHHHWLAWSHSLFHVFLICQWCQENLLALFLPESTTRRIPKICTIAVHTAFGTVLNLIHGALDRDHAGGNNGIKKLLKDVKVYGGVKDKVEGCTHPVQHHDEFPISSSIRVKALETSWYVSFFPWTLHNGLSLYSTGVCGLIFFRPYLLFDSLVWMYAVILRGTSATL